MLIQWGTDESSETYGRKIKMPVNFSSVSSYVVVCVRYANADYNDTSCTVLRVDGQTFKFFTDSSRLTYIAIGY